MRIFATKSQYIVSMRQCQVFVHGEYAGILTEENDKNYRFVYDDAYAQQADNSPVCLAMPLREKEYNSEVLFPFFFNLLSEGANRKMQSELLHIDPEDDFGILMETAQYDTIGAVTVKPI